MNEITNEEYEYSVRDFKKLNGKDYTIVDIRDELSYAYGHLPDAVNVPNEELEQKIDSLRGKKVIVYCKKGITGREATAYLRENQIEAYNLQGGYIAWLLDVDGLQEKAD